MCGIGAYAQNVGIGTTTPTQKLDIKQGRLRFSGDPSAGNVQGIEFTKTDGVSLNGFLGKYNDSTIGFYGFTGFGWGMLFNNTNGNIGLQGNTNPRTPLSFSNASGNKLSIYDNGNGTYYGIGLQAARFQFYVPTAAQAFVFGTGSSASFVENMRINGDGKVGIGTNNPTQKLDVTGNINTTGTLYANGASVGGSVYLAGNLTGDGGAFISDNLEVGGDAKVSNNLEVDGDAVVTGTLKIKGGNPGTGKVLTSNATGTGSWETLNQANINSAFRAHEHVIVNNMVYGSIANKGVALKLNFRTFAYPLDDFDDAGAYNNITKRFVAPAAGTYHFDGNIEFGTNNSNNFNYATSNGTIYAFLRKNGYSGYTIVDKAVVTGQPIDQSFPFSCTLKLAAGEYLDVVLTQSVINSIRLGNGTVFSGYRLY